MNTKSGGVRQSEIEWNGYEWKKHGTHCIRVRLDKTKADLRTIYLLSNKLTEKNNINTHTHQKKNPSSNRTRNIDFY